MSTISSGSAQSINDDLIHLGDDFTVGVAGALNTGSSVSTSGNHNSPIYLQESFITLNAAWRQKIKAVLTSKLEHIFKENSLELNPSFSVQEFIREAYIEIRDIGGIPVAVVIGKHPIAFGQNIHNMPLFEKNPLKDINEIEEVYGVTVTLTEGLFGLFDKVELSVFETKGLDLELGKIDGISVRLSKFLTEQWLLTISHAELGNNHLTSGHERRTSIGLIGETKKGDLVGWIEGTIFSNNPQYPNSSFSITGGLMYRVHATTDVMVQYTYIHNALHDLGLAVKTNITKNLTVGAEVRYRNYVERNEHELIFGIALTYTFGIGSDRENQDYLFGNEKKDDEDLEMN
jgi:hypothetical protein